MLSCFIFYNFVLLSIPLNMCLRLFFSLFLLLSAVVCNANGDPVVHYCAISRVANPEPLTLADLQIEREEVHFSRKGIYNVFDVVYTLVNRSDTTYQRIDYGFPIDYEDSENGLFGNESDAIFESEWERGWNDRYIRQVAFRLDGFLLTSEVSVSQIKAAKYENGLMNTENEDTEIVNYEPPVMRRWYYTHFPVGPHQSVQLHVHYEVMAGHTKALYGTQDLTPYQRQDTILGDIALNIGRYLSSNFRILYDFRPAKHFGNGRIGTFVMTFDLGKDIVNPTTNDGLPLSLPPIVRHDVQATELATIDFTVNHDIMPFATLPQEAYVSAENYVVRAVSDTLWQIDFKRAQYFTELALPIDTNRVRRITLTMLHPNGSKKDITYSYEPANWHWYGYQNTWYGKPAILAANVIDNTMAHDAGNNAVNLVVTPATNPQTQATTVYLHFDHNPGCKPSDLKILQTQWN